ncbi:hypothetical protein BC830DRAFT_1171931 [Chytriomyces sp. MP71]|nr:hypothetical protein BC830DRAFT_1171931 [Chytriomyces sp. MP71]
MHDEPKQKRRSSTPFLTGSRQVGHSQCGVSARKWRRTHSEQKACLHGSTAGQRSVSPQMSHVSSASIWRRCAATAAALASSAGIVQRGTGLATADNGKKKSVLCARLWMHARSHLLRRLSPPSPTRVAQWRRPVHCASALGAPSSASALESPRTPPTIGAAFVFASPSPPSSPSSEPFESFESASSHSQLPNCSSSTNNSNHPLAEVLANQPLASILATPLAMRSFAEWALFSLEDDDH